MRKLSEVYDLNSRLAFCSRCLEVFRDDLPPGSVLGCPTCKIVALYRESLPAGVEPKEAEDGRLLLPKEAFTNGKRSVAD